MEKLASVVSEMEREFQRLMDENSRLWGRIEGAKAALQDAPQPVLAAPPKPNGVKRKGGRGRPAIPAEKVAEMKALRAKGLAVVLIAKKLGVTPITVYKYTKA